MPIQGTLPAPECRFGYPRSQVDQIVAGRRSEFNAFMAGQTVSECNGQEYDHAEKVYKPTGCGPHGIVIYGDDLRRFLLGLPVID